MTFSKSDPTCSTCPAFCSNKCHARPPSMEGWPAVDQADFCCEHPEAPVLSSVSRIEAVIIHAANHLGNVWQEFPAMLD